MVPAGCQAHSPVEAASPGWPPVAHWHLMHNETPTGAVYPEKTSRRAIEAGEASRTAFLTALQHQGGRVYAACETSGVAKPVYRKWRQRYPSFRSKVDTIKASFHNVDARQKVLAGGFAAFRLKYFGFESPDYHLEIVDALENSPEGSVTLILLPPEHGKTTIVEDFCNYKLAKDPNFRITVGSQNVKHSRKVIGRVKERMDDNGPCPAYVIDFGPFKPDASRKTQTWAADMFNVWQKNSGERDYSMQALGITSSIQGTRADLMIIDDVQGTTNINETVAILEKLRQDWLSRAGSFGRTVILGTRVGPGDVYEELENSPLVNRVIKYPAYKGEMKAWTEPKGHNPKEDPREIPHHITTWLWPERYSALNYLVMRVNAGETPWARNYMQRADLGGTNPFKADMLAAAARPEFSLTYPRHRHLDGELVIGLDPGFGVNAIVAALMTEKFVLPIAWRVDYELTNNQQIWQCVEDVIMEVNCDTQRVTEVVIEDKAFQKGLLDDMGLVDLRDRFGFRSHGHQTGENKYDPDLGIPQMARSFERGEILLPGAGDAHTKTGRIVLDDQMIKWRPYKRGNRLTQDLVIGLWFCWMTWRRCRNTLGSYSMDTQGWKTSGLPYAATGAGLILPTGSYGR